ncbi:ATP-binding protein [Marinobacter sp. C2H3]|uniref:ATP-binding protein n=1 Tax=Marinobacter sp. C2H3 TaxID=3119003 RepID=UPI00300EABD5
MTERFSDQFDFNRCEDEPIRTPGAIQSHGAVLLLDEHSLALTGFSENAAAVLEQITGQPQPSAQAWRADAEPLAPLLAPLKQALDAKAAPAFPLRYPLAGGRRPWQATVTRRAGRLLLELEAGLRAGGGAVDTTVADLAQLIGQVKAARSVSELVQTAAAAVRSITGYDRVMVYRFAEDWHGEVVAESSAEGMVRFLGLHFPAGDIPAQARALYLENEIRMIADVDAPVVPIISVSTLARDTQPDLSDCALRAVSPIHLQYLRNMNVAASMSISLIRDGRLWGLIACHHRKPRYLPVDARLAARLVGDVLSMCLRLVEDSDVMKARLRHNLRQTELLQRFVQSDELVPSLVANGEELRQLFGASGFAVVDGNRVHSTGDAPDATDLLVLARGLRREMETQGQVLWSTSECRTEWFEGQASQAAGLLALAPASDDRVLVVWTRAEAPEQITWAGRADKLPDDPLNPRASFERWSELSRGKARPWTNWELEAAEGMLSALQKLALRQLERLQRLSENLARSNKDLEDFAFIASHDLQEPLRKIEAFSSMITEELDAPKPDTDLLRDYLSRITGASSRLRHLVSDLLTYSRVGRLDYEQAECDWAEVLGKTVDLLDVRTAYVDARVTIRGEFPVTRSAPVLLRMVFQNLLSNALKYGDAERLNEITVEGRKLSDGSYDIRVSDTGIGFDPEMSEAIFKPFLRLNSKSRYPGSGIGLAIVRKAASRLGATVTASSVPDQGSEFRVLVPAELAAPAGA